METIETTFAKLSASARLQLARAYAYGVLPTDIDLTELEAHKLILRGASGGEDAAGNTVIIEHQPSLSVLGRAVSKLAARHAHKQLAELTARAQANAVHTFFNALTDNERDLIHELADCDSLIFWERVTGKAAFQSTQAQ